MSILRRASVAMTVALAVAACGASDPGSGHVLLDRPPSTVAPECPEGTVPLEVPAPPAPAGVVPAPPEPARELPSATPPVFGADLADVMPWPAGAPAPRAADGRWSVVYVGDSMAQLTVCLLQAELADWTVIDVTYGGTAPCDWVDHPWLADALGSAPDLVVFSFIGNSITECTEQAIGPTLLDAYERDLLTICAMAEPARCVAVGQPVLDPGISRTLPGPDEPNGMFRSHADAGDWGFVDAGHAAEGVDGSFAPEMRELDGVHFNDAGAAATARRIADYLRAAVIHTTP